MFYAVVIGLVILALLGVVILYLAITDTEDEHVYLNRAGDNSPFL
jgi:hypothetical protein